MSVIVVAVLGATGIARAQAADVEREARAMFEAGNLAYDAGRFDDALERFQQAYALSHRPELLWNIAVSADRARKDELALSMYERYLTDTAGDARDADLHERATARSAELRAQLEDEAREDARADALAREADEAAAREAEARAARDRALRDARANRVTRKWWFWAIVGAGIATAVAVPLAVTANRTVDGSFPETSHGNVVFALRGTY